MIKISIVIVSWNGSFLLCWLNSRFLVLQAMMSTPINIVLVSAQSLALNGKPGINWQCRTFSLTIY
jgi:hypothetical protein